MDFLPFLSVPSMANDPLNKPSNGRMDGSFTSEGRWRINSKSCEGVTWGSAPMKFHLPLIICWRLSTSATKVPFNEGTVIAAAGPDEAEFFFLLSSFLSTFPFPPPFVVELEITFLSLPFSNLLISSSFFPKLDCKPSATGADLSKFMLTRAAVILFDSLPPLSCLVDIARSVEHGEMLIPAARWLQVAIEIARFFLYRTKCTIRESR
mmetsp:Transcript_29074/g.66619  ORF Transcript_29074/g.66619 Transcript_29074/m.66619 type:complete len:208 (+) Transcript_29074:1663-2286(+)